MSATSLEHASALPEAWIAHMLRGDFAAAWNVSDEILRTRGPSPTSHLPRHVQSVWRGQQLEGRRVLVRCYHGLGDTLQFIRYAPLVSAIASELTVWAQPQLLRLLSTVRGIGRLLPLHDGSPDVSYDVDVEIMELPYVFRTTLESIPVEVPYLHVTPLPRKSRDLAVGIVWAGGDWDARRSVPYDLLAPLAKVPGVSLHAMQRGPRRSEWREGFGTLANVRDSFEEAQLMRALDLVITIDSMPAHLAGALGVPVWTLLHHEPDWRWMSRGERTPWYPTMRLFRQQHPGDWESVISRVAAELAHAAHAARTARQHPRTHARDFTLQGAP